LVTTDYLQKALIIIPINGIATICKARIRSLDSEEIKLAVQDAFKKIEK